MFKDVKSAIDFIERRTASRYQSNRFNEVFEKYQLGNVPFSMIQIAGTNGKGSTSRMIAEMLTTTPLKVGLFSSPHLLKHHERFQIDHINISDELLLYYINLLYEDIIEYRLIMFEIDFLIALLYFKDQQIDLAIIEVGIGGLHDTTNIVTPLISVITNVSYDHQDLLGDTLQEIAKEKAGIIKKGVPVISGIKELELRKIIDDKAKQAMTAVEFIEEPIVNVVDHQLEYHEQGFLVRLNTMAEYQGINSRIAIAVIQRLKSDCGYDINVDSAIKALQSFKISGRFEVVSEKPRMIVDGAHNVAGIQALIETTQSLDEDFVIVFSALARKDYQEMLKLLQCEYQEVVFLEFDQEGSIKQKDVDNLNVKVFNELEAVIRYYRNKYPDKTIVFCGSLYFIADVIKGLSK